MGQVGDALENLGAPDLEQRGRRSRIDPARHLGDNAQFGRLQGKYVELDAGDVLDELSERRIVVVDFGPHDLLEPVQITRRTADSGHAGALVAEQEFCVGPALVLLADQVFDRYADIFEKDVVDLVRAVNGDDGAHGDTGRFHVDQQEGDAGLRLSRNV